MIGPNGAGKTSTMRMLIDPSAPDASQRPDRRETGDLGAPILRHVGVLIDGPALVEVWGPTALVAGPSPGVVTGRRRYLDQPVAGASGGCGARRLRHDLGTLT